MKLVYHPSCIEYGRPGHPESPERVRLSHEYLKGNFDFIEPAPAEPGDVLRAHTRAHLVDVQNGHFADLDSPAYESIYDHALLSAGGALTAMRLALKGEGAFSLMRPPGHHAGRESVAGFCYFNNIAIAVAAALDEVERVAIVDFDCHHGNGTEEIFMGHERVLFVSLHQSPLYPGTGLASRKNCHNYPIASLTGEKEYLEIFSQALGVVSDFDPDLIGVSAGFDAYKRDPITSLDLGNESFGKIGQLIKNLKKPIFSLLEGGYSHELPECIESYLVAID